MILIKQESNTTHNLWGAKFLHGFKGFDIVHQVLGQYWPQFKGLPDIGQFNAVAQDYYNVAHTPIQRQVGFEPQRYDVAYEDNVFKHKKVYTRSNSWHDFFNNITWLLWPKTKWAIVDTILAQFSLEKISSLKNRTPKQSFLAQLDECGMLIVTACPDLIEHVQQHDWLDLFFHQRARHSLFEPIIFGHGLMEKALEPYVGMTGKAMMIIVKPQYFGLSTVLRLKFLDEVMSKLIRSKYCPQSPRSLQPFPLLGMPRWHPNNVQKEFFDQKHYFRSKRSDFAGCAVLNQLADKSLWGQWKWLAPCDLSPE